MVTKREKKLIDRLRALEYPMQMETPVPPFKLMVRPFTTSGISLGKLATWFEDELFSHIQKKSLQPTISGIIFFPKIFDPARGPNPKDYVRYKKDENFYFVSKDVDYFEWTRGSDREKLTLLSENLKKCVAAVRGNHFSQKDHDSLVSAINYVHKCLEARLLH